jgi:hypothetical protein
MTRAVAVRKADLDRVLKALRDAGQAIRYVELRPDGHVIIVPMEKEAMLPMVEGGAVPNALDERRARKLTQRLPNGS